MSVDLDNIPPGAFPIDLDAPILSGNTSLTASAYIPLVDEACDSTYDYLRSSLTMSAQNRLQVQISQLSDLQESLRILINANVDKQSALERYVLLYDRINEAISTAKKFMGYDDEIENNVPNEKLEKPENNDETLKQNGNPLAQSMQMSLLQVEDFLGLDNDENSSNSTSAVELDESEKKLENEEGEKQLAEPENEEGEKEVAEAENGDMFCCEICYEYKSLSDTCTFKCEHRFCKNVIIF